MIRFRVLNQDAVLLFFLVNNLCVHLKKMQKFTTLALRGGGGGLRPFCWGGVFLHRFFDLPAKSISGRFRIMFTDVCERREGVAPTTHVSTMYNVPLGYQYVFFRVLSTFVHSPQVFLWQAKQDKTYPNALCPIPSNTVCHYSELFNQDIYL